MRVPAGDDVMEGNLGPTRNYLIMDSSAYLASENRTTIVLLALVPSHAIAYLKCRRAGMAAGE